MSEPSWIEEAGGKHVIESNWLFELRKERYRSRQTDHAHDYYVLHLADVVNIVALTCAGELILVRQFRAGSRHDSLETPGGLLDEGEDPRAAAARELREETGYQGSAPRSLGSIWVNPSLLTSRVTFVLIEDCQLMHPPAPDHGEEVTVELVHRDHILQAIREGVIDHALSVCALLWWHTHVEL